MRFGQKKKKEAKPDRRMRIKLSGVGWICLGLFLLIGALCFLGPWFTGYRFDEQNTALGASAPASRLYANLLEDASPRLAEDRLRRLLANNPLVETGEIRSVLHQLNRGLTVERTLVRVSVLARTREGGYIAPFLVDPNEVDRAQTEVLLRLDPASVRSIGEASLLREEDWALAAMGRKHLLGTDELGRDLLTRILTGGRLSIGVGLAATLVAVVIGVAYGSLSGFMGGRVDAIMMRIVDTLYALPFLIFVILLMVVFGRSLLLLFLAIGAVEWLTMARIVRGQTLYLKEQAFVDALRVIGVPPVRILWKHIVPNCLGPIIVVATLSVPAVMLLESVLSFLGLGVQPPMSSWGLLIKEGAEKMETFPWLLLAPTVFFVLTLLSLNFLGDELRDRLSPRAR